MKPSYELLAPGGIFVSNLQSDISEEQHKKDNKRVVCPVGVLRLPGNRALGGELYKVLPKLLESGDIKVRSYPIKY
jgi:hypothetical protein